MKIELGAYNFISLATGARISRHRWTELPIPDTVIARVEALALHEKQPLLQRSGLVVEWRHDQAIDDTPEYDLDYEPPPRPDADPDVLPLEDYDAIDDDELADLHQPLLDVPQPFPAVAQGAPQADDTVGIDDDLEYNNNNNGDDDDDDYDNAEHNEDGPNAEDDFDGDNSYGTSDEDKLNGDDATLLNDAEAGA